MLLQAPQDCRVSEVNYSTAHHWYSIYLETMGKHEEAIAGARRALELDPLSLIINTSSGGRHHYACRYDQAIEQYRRTLEMDPNFGYAHWALGQAYEQKGMYEEAIAKCQRAITLSGDDPPFIATLGHTYTVAGKRSEEMKILKELKERSKREYVTTYYIAGMYAGLGQKEQAFEWLEKAYEEREVALAKVDPWFDPLRSDPRFQSLLHRMNLPG